MQVTFIPGNEVNSDLGVVNAARVSLDKKSEWGKVSIGTTRILKESDEKLIKYLAIHNHWTPFSHARLYFQLMRFSGHERLYFYENAHQAGFSLTRIDKRWYLKGSLYGFLSQLQGFKNAMIHDAIADSLCQAYPISTAAYLPRYPYPSFQYASGAIATDEAYIALIAPKHPELYKLLTATLYVKVPLFVARQIRTSQVGFMYSDCYVEGEAFSYNEVSRRYVDKAPEFYQVRDWRVREPGKVKQGSTGVGDRFMQATYRTRSQVVYADALALYTAMCKDSTAPEQARALLPQSMYTEFYMTGSLHRWAQWIALRQMSDVMEETQEACSLVLESLKAAYPTWSSRYNF